LKVYYSQDTISTPKYFPLRNTDPRFGASGGEFKKGDVVATAMGGMRRDFDGGYAEFACVPASQVQLIKTKISWKLLGALPEMMQTAWGSLVK
jgi:NADPH:quinone reductase-like Zn-dependent oxidoreductase